MRSNFAKPFLPIAPAPPRDDGGGDGTGTPSSTRMAAVTPPPRKRTIRSACIRCREKKVSCDSKQPACTRCAKHNHQCEYRAQGAREIFYMDLQRKLSQLEDTNNDLTKALTSLTQTTSIESAIALVQELRRTQNVSTLTERLTKATFPSYMASRSILHPALQSSTMSFESTIAFSRQQPNVYPPIFSIAGNQCQLEAFLSNVPHISFDSSEGVLDSLDRLLDNGLPVESGSSHDVHNRYIDSRLCHVDVAFWTSVPVSKEFIGSAISHYLKTDHPIEGLFDADLFLDNLSANKQMFCSRLMLNSLMFVACQGYGRIEEAAPTIGLAFYEEASRHWQLLQDTPSLTTAISAHLLTIGCIMVGRDDIAIKYLSQGKAMAIRLNLIGTCSSAEVLSAFEILDPEWLRASAHAAWGIYNCLYSLHYHVQETCLPPVLPIPGDIVVSSTQQMQRVLNSYTSPPYMGSTFVAISKFWLIYQDIVFMYYDSFSVKITERTSVAFVKSMYMKIMAWAESLDPACLRQPDCPHHVIILHCLLHIGLIDLFRPFAEAQARAAWKDPSISPSVFCLASMQQLQQLILVYAAHHRKKCNTILWHTALLYVANSALEMPGLAYSNYFLRICMEAYHELSSTFRVCGGVLRGLLALAIDTQAMTKAQADALFQPSATSAYNLFGSEPVKANWILYLDSEAHGSGKNLVYFLDEKFALHQGVEADHEYSMARNSAIVEEQDPVEA